MAYIINHAFPIKEVNLKLKKLSSIIGWPSDYRKSPKLSKIKRDTKQTNLYLKLLKKSLKKFITQESLMAVNKI